MSYSCWKSEEEVLPWEAFQSVCTALRKGETRSRHEVLHRARDEHFTRLGPRHHPGADVDGDPTERVAGALALAGVDTGAHLESQLANPFADALGAAHRARGAVEGGEEAIAHGHPFVRA